MSKISEWMMREALDDDAVARALGVDRSTISRVRRGKLRAGSVLIEKWVRYSNGALMPNDFFDLSEAA